jgi:hypothetical protein
MVELPAQPKEQAKKLPGQTATEACREVGPANHADIHGSEGASNQEAFADFYLAKFSNTCGRRWRSQGEVAAASSETERD